MLLAFEKSVWHQLIQINISLQIIIAFFPVNDNLVLLDRAGFYFIYRWFQRTVYMPL